MKITSKGQVTIPLAVRQRAGLHPHTEVDFEVLSNGDVLIRRVVTATTGIRSAFERVRGSANAVEFRGMSTDQFMKFLRGSPG